jgi:hypothetical protein
MKLNFAGWREGWGVGVGVEDQWQGIAGVHQLTMYSG